MTIDAKFIGDYWVFSQRLLDLRAPWLLDGDQAIDRSVEESTFLFSYLKLIDMVKKVPSVTEYGGAVPSMSLYLLSQKRLDKLVVVDRDFSSMDQLRHVCEDLKLPVEIVEDDINKMSEFPDTDLAVGFNALYGPSPNFASVKCPPVLKRPVIMEASYAGFGVFRSTVLYEKWREKNEVIKQMEKRYLHHEVDRNTEPFAGMRKAVVKKKGVVRRVGEATRVNLHYVLGWDRKP